MPWEDLTLEGAATGLHVHLRVPPSAFAATFNAAQAAIAPGRSPLATNSPLLLGTAAVAARRGSRSSARRWTTARRSARSGCPRAPRSGTAGSAGRSSRSPRASPCTSRCCRCVAERGPAGGGGGRRRARPRRAAPAPRHGLAVEPGGGRSRRRSPPAHRDAGAPRRSVAARHAANVAFLVGPDDGARAPDGLDGPLDAVRVRAAQLLRRRPRGPRGGAAVAVLRGALPAALAGRRARHAPDPRGARGPHRLRRGAAEADALLAVARRAGPAQAVTGRRLAAAALASFEDAGATRRRGARRDDRGLPRPLRHGRPVHEWDLPG